MVGQAGAAGIMEAVQQGMLLGALLMAFSVAALGMWLRSPRAQRTVTSHADAGTVSPDPSDPAVALARLRFAHGEIGPEDLRRVLQALSREWHA
ncbi:MAG: hypothetical protein IBX62_08535 [Coriobacteriia bacterium]|nr:hypothetical protein [Coriobacteriia bacterium]